MRILFQERDGELLETIGHYDGLLARRHLRGRFWPSGKTPRAMEKRLAKLKRAGYIDFPTPELYGEEPIPESIIWLEWKGIVYVAEKKGVFMDLPAEMNETRKRLLQKDLKQKGIRWMRRPRYGQVLHDLTTIDTRMAIENSVNEIPGLELEEWIPEGVFYTEMDPVEYTIRISKGGRKRVRRGVRPDGYFVILHLERDKAGLPPRARYLLELDNATHPMTRFGNKKVLAFLAYMKSPRFKKRFGDNNCEVLVVTKSPQRMKNLIRQTKESTGDDARLFRFSTFEELGISRDQRGSNGRADERINVITSPIWTRIGNQEKMGLYVE